MLLDQLHNNNTEFVWVGGFLPITKSLPTEVELGWDNMEMLYYSIIWPGRPVGGLPAARS